MAVQFFDEVYHNHQYPFLSVLPISIIDNLTRSKAFKNDNLLEDDDYKFARNYMTDLLIQQKKYLKFLKVIF